MKRLLLLSSLAALLFGCEDLPGRPDPADRYQRPAEIADFDTLYAAQCSGCHGEDGTHGAARPLGDPLYLAFVPQARVREVIAGGVPGTAMPGFAAEVGGWLTEAQIDLLTSGIFERWAAPDRVPTGPLPPYDEAASLAAGHEPGNPLRGVRAYETFCADCHGPGGKGGEKAGSVVDPSFLSLVSPQMLRISILAGRPDLGMPDWRTLSETRPISAQEVSDLVALLETRRPQAAPMPAAATRP